MGQIPTENLELTRHLYSVEVALRELIIEKLNSLVGSRWYKQRIPDGIRKESLRLIDAEKHAKWMSHVRHHPIYYTNFAELKIIIERQDNWRDVFQPIFGSKDVFIGTLVELDPIRNKVAHNRRATEADLQIARAALEKLATAIGPEYFSRLVGRCSACPNLVEMLLALRQEVNDSYAAVSAYNEISSFLVWSSINHEWWFDNEYLGVSLEPLEHFFQRLSEYATMPRTRGSGHALEEWFITNGIAGLRESALSCLDMLILK